MSRIRYIFCVVLIVFSNLSFAQRFEGSYVHVTDSIVKIIADYQSRGDHYFDEGIFPSYRWYNQSNKIIKDDNIFFTQIILFSLQKIEEGLSENAQKLVQDIRRKGLKNYPSYRNKDGKLSYNFWKTKPSSHFPNSRVFSKSKKFKIPDDLDDTSLAYLSMDSVSKISLYELKLLMQQHANGSEKWIENIDEKYRYRPFYSTWFGEKMPIELDVCVLANILCLSYEYGLDLNRSDSASLLLLRDIVLSKEHLSKAAYYSPSYKLRSIVLYHLARLIGFYHPELLQPLAPQLISEIEQEILHSTSAMETIILSTSLYRLGESPPANIDFSALENDLEYFSFFNSNIASTFRDPLKKWFIKSPCFSLKHICPAYNYTLLLEYLVYKHQWSAAFVPEN